MSEPIRIDGEYQTRDGKPVRILCVDRSASIWKVVALATFPKGTEAVICCDEFGRYGRNGPMDHDLIPNPKRESRWANIDPDGLGNFFSSRALADTYASKSRLAVIRVDFEDDKLVAVALEPLAPAEE